MKIFITGGAGFIGSHTSLELLQRGYSLMIFDDLSNSSLETINRVRELAGKKLEFVQGDVRDFGALHRALSRFRPEAVVHFAALKSVAQSVKDPIQYHDVNIIGSINLLKAMDKVNCSKIVFSSSATVYGMVNEPPFTELDRTSPISPYGNSKLIFEQILKDWTISSDVKRAIVLRYFNPVGAHQSGLLGESIHGTPGNLMPAILQVVTNIKPHLKIYGKDYETKDGTGERDYIHVVDLAKGHISALEKIDYVPQFQILNLGSGVSTSVLELVEKFEECNGLKIPIKFSKRRSGDTAISFADPTQAEIILGFKCSKTIEDMCVDSYNWIKKNPTRFMN